ncbi:MAG: hypothetical protein ACTSW1_11870 [Candidatus Hodarchaeales archaeon]
MIDSEVLSSRVNRIKSLVIKLKEMTKLDKDEFENDDVFNQGFIWKK